MANDTLPNGPNGDNAASGEGHLFTIDIEQELRRSYLGYAVSTLVSRALPDVRDGFKPVQRRILYAMRELGVGPGSARVKSAKVVGECFVAGTLVNTPKGLVPIEALEAGDEVYTQKGARRVTQAYIMPAQPLLEVELADGRKNICTPGQQFKVLTENLEIAWKPAKELRPGEYVLSRSVHASNQESESAESIPLDEDMAYVLGFFLADGWIDRDSKRGYDRLSIAAVEQSILLRLQAILCRKFDAPSKITQQGDRYSLQVCDTQINHRLHAMFQVVEQGFAFSPVKSIRPADAQVTYDIQVEEDHEFIANGMLVHNCMGNFHPHGDQALYGTLVRMAQDFSMRYPLIDPQGNFGSVDGDPPAAQRYTECRLTPLAMEMMEDIERDTVDWRPNYDQSRREPIVLPGKFPNFLCNGGEGIAVGMSTSVPPHNLREVVEACIFALDHPDATAEDLLRFIPGPDFPTAGLILGTKGAQEAYRTGRGRVIMQAQLQIEPMDNGKNAIVVTELPYQVNKRRLIEHIADLVRHKRVEGITEINDFSNKDGMRVVIELRRDVMPKRMVNYLLKHTALRQTFGIIMLALVNGQPRLLNLAQVLHLFLSHRKEVIVRRTRYELARAKNAAHIREGQQIALNFLDEIIALIRAASNSEAARSEMVARFGLTQIQAESILGMQLRQISQLERQKIEDEYKNLLKQIAHYEDILVNPARVIKILKEELRGLRDKYGDDRRTRILPTEADEITEDDLIPEEKTLVTISRDGYIKRVPLDTYRTQKRGGRGVQAANLKEEDLLAHLFMATTTHYILFFTNRGRVYRLKAYEVPQTTRQARGQHINNFIQTETGDQVTAILPMKDLRAEGYLLMATENGEVKRTALSEFANLRANGLICFDIEEGDNLKWVQHTDGQQEVIMVTRKGMSIRFKEEAVPERGRPAGGVRGIEMRDPKTKALADSVVAMDVVSPTSQLLVASENGFGKRTDLAHYRAQSRGGKGLITMNITSKTGPIVDAAVVEPEDKLMVLTEKGITIRMDIAGIRAAGRSTQGVKLINLEDNDRVGTIARLIDTEALEEVANAEAEAQEQQNGANGGSGKK